MIWTRELLWKLLSQELWTIAKFILEVWANLYIHIFVEEEAGELFEEVLHIQPTCYSMLHNVTQYAYLMFNICIIQ